MFLLSKLLVFCVRKTNGVLKHRRYTSEVLDSTQACMPAHDVAKARLPVCMYLCHPASFVSAKLCAAIKNAWSLDSTLATAFTMLLWNLERTTGSMRQSPWEGESRSVVTKSAAFYGNQRCITAIKESADCLWESKNEKLGIFKSAPKDSRRVICSGLISTMERWRSNLARGTLRWDHLKSRASVLTEWYCSNTPNSGEGVLVFHLM